MDMYNDRGELPVEALQEAPQEAPGQEDGRNENTEEQKELFSERISLAFARIALIREETDVAEPFRSYFRAVSSFLLTLSDIRDRFLGGALKDMDVTALLSLQDTLYRDYLPEHYGESFLNPSCASLRCGTEWGALLSAVYFEMLSLPRFVFERRDCDLCPGLELFLQVYGLFRSAALDGAAPEPKEVRDVFYWYASDYLDQTVPERNRELLAALSEDSVQERLFFGFSPDDLRYLCFSGDYITDTTLRTAEYLAGLPEEDIRKAARAMTDGFIRGFAVMNKDLSGKKTVQIRWVRGFERLVDASAKLFQEAGLSVTLPGSPGRLSERIPGSTERGIAVSPNRQADYDHRFDSAFIWDKAFTGRKISLLRQSYEALREEAAVYAGPAVLQTFGEARFDPENSPYAPSFTNSQRTLFRQYMGELSELRNTYMPEDETSFTIIAWPIPEIGPFYEDLFRDTLKINTGDNAFYVRVQQKLIDVLDRADHVEVRGRGGNETSLQVALRELKDPERETRFENCTADVNIPAGEVFTSPVLKGTNGLLHVSRVYIDGLLFRELRLTFTDGLVTAFGCANYTSAEENRRLVREAVLGDHDSLPMGEFAIGTGTEILAMAHRYGAEDKLPILMAEKTGPHFAVGDTCYSHEEDAVSFNPDGKAIVARENEISAKRREAPEEAYFNWHKDVTLPYGELGCVTAVMPDGSRTDLLRDGRFVLPGTEELNRWLPPSEEGKVDAGERKNSTTA